MRGLVLCTFAILISVIGADQRAAAQRAAPKITVSYPSFNMPAAKANIGGHGKLLQTIGD